MVGIGSEVLASIGPILSTTSTDNSPRDNFGLADSEWDYCPISKHTELPANAKVSLSKKDRAIVPGRIRQSKIVPGRIVRGSGRNYRASI